MSKIVKSIGRAVKKVVKGVVNVAKKVIKSPIGKALVMAAAIYFGGPAVMGLLGSGGAAAAGGLSGLSGMAANLGAAWSGLTGAGSALLAGDLAGAGGALATGFAGDTAATAAANALYPGVNAAAPMVGAEQMSLEALRASELAGSGAQAAQIAANAATKNAPSFLAGLMNSPYTAPALIQAGSSVLQSVGQGKMAQAAIDEENRRRAEDIALRNANMGVLPASQSDPGPGYYKRSSFADRITG